MKRMIKTSPSNILTGQMSKLIMKKGFFLLLLFYTSLSLAQIKVGDNPENISPYALLELESSSQGLLLPRMTTAQRDANFNQATPVGIMIFNTDENVLQYFMEEIDPTSKRKTGLKVWENATDETPAVGPLPEMGEMGELFFNTDNNALYYYTQEGWNQLSTGGVNNTFSSDTVFQGDILTYVSDGVTNTLDLSQLGSSTLSLSDTLLSISNGNFVDLATVIDARIVASSLNSSTTTGPAGPAGPVGSAGPAGAPGQDGAGFLVAAGVPSSTVASATFYVDSATGDQYYNNGGGNTWNLVSTGTTPPSLSATSLTPSNTMELAISTGNSITLDFSTLATTAGTDSQTIAYGGSGTATETTLGISKGNTLTLQASGSLSFTQTGTDTLLLTALGESVPATITHSSQRYDGTNWVEDPTRLSDGSRQVTVTTDLNVVGDTNLSASLEVTGNTSMTSDLVVAGNTTTSGTLTALSTVTLGNNLVDASGDAGVDGQLLSATATGTNWITTGTLPATAGQNTNTTAYWNGSAWVNNQKLLSDGSTTTSITTNLSATGTKTTISSNAISLTGTTTIDGDAISLTGPTTITGNATVTQDLTVAANTTTSGTLTANSTVTFNRNVVDGQGNAGSPGQFLSATGTQTSWISIAGDTVTSTTSNYNASIDDDTILVLPAAAVTITLPTPSSDDNGKKLTVKRGNAYTGPTDTLAIVPSTGTIDGAANLRLNVGYQGYTLQAFAGNWYIIQRF